MFIKNLLKKIMRGGEEEMKNILLIMLVAVLVFSVTGVCSAAVKTATYNVTATVPTMAAGMELKVYKIIPSSTDCTGNNDTWPSATAPSETSLAFGNLVWDSTYKIFRGAQYFAIDVGVSDNTGVAWTITHTRTNVASGTNNLNNKINVTFAKVVKTGTVDNVTVLNKYSYADSNSRSYAKATLTNAPAGWLRVYYGIASGIGPTTPNPNGCVVDAANVTPIGTDTRAGTYTGSVTLTLTP